MECESVKEKERECLAEVVSLREWLATLKKSIGEMEESGRQKDRILAMKEEEFRSARVELAGLNLSHSRLEHHEKNRIRELEN